MGVMGVSLISPTLPGMREALALTDAQTSLVITAYTLPGIVLAPFLGVLADRVGRRRTLIPCLLLYGVAGGAVVLTREYPLILALRVLQGSAASGLVSLAVTLIGDSFSGTQRNTVMGVNGAVLSVGTASYPLLGGALSAVDWTAPFGLYVVGVVVGVFAFRSLPEPEIDRGPRGLDYFRGALASVPTRKTLAYYATAVAIFVLLYGAILTALPFLLDRTYGLSAFRIGLVLTVSSAMTAIVSSQNGRLSRRFSNARLVAFGFVGYGLGLIAIYLAPSPLYVAGGILFFGAGQGLAMPSLDTAVSSLGPDRFRGAVMSLRTSVIRIGQTVGPPLFAAAAVTGGYRPVLAVAGVVTLVVGSVAILAVRDDVPTPAAG
jgi:MFS family permease